MSSQSDSERYAREVQDLRRQSAAQSAIVAKERKEEASLRVAASRATSTSTQRSRANDAERHADKANAAERKRADLDSKAAVKEKQMYEARAKADKERTVLAERERKQQVASVKDLETRLRRSYESSSVRQLLPTSTGHLPDLHLTERVPEPAREFDFFISHASEDKADIARPLYEALSVLEMKVWFDEAELTIGDSLRRRIDEGLARSRYGVVILSHAFFAKQWPQSELDGLFSRQVNEDRKVILPIWHKLSKDEVNGYSPILAGTLAAQTSLQTVAEIAAELSGLATAPHAE